MAVLVAGATGYIGRRLVTDLVAAGHRVRCVARTPGKLDAEPWRDRVEVVAGDVLDRPSLTAALCGVDVAYYLVHSIGSEPGWQTRDRLAAENFRDLAAEADIDQIIYLGGLGDDAGGALSPHLASRHEVGRVLAAGAVPVTELRAAVVIGSGSASFEMLRHLVEVLPMMTTPRWVKTRVQPIAVRDVLAYLSGVLGIRDAIELALQRVGEIDVSTRWADAELYGRSPADPIPTDPGWAGATVLVDRQVVNTGATPQALYREICTLGGERGWLVGDWLWTIRGWLDRLAGGVGVRRGRGHPVELRVGDVVDFWRVEALAPSQLVRLRAEMRLPGDAWLEWSIESGPSTATLVQRAMFRPRGLWGRVYWYAVAPFHRFVFGPLARRIAEQAEVDGGSHGSRAAASE